MRSPHKSSFSLALAEEYSRAAQESGAEVSLYNLAEYNFNPNLTKDKKYGEQMEPVLQEIRTKIKETQHLVFVYPNWWGTYPAIFKAFIDRVFTKGFAYRFKENNPIRIPLLTGKTARILVSMDTPKWYYRWIYHQPGHYAIKKCTLEFCGIKPVRITTFTPIKNTTDKQREKYLKKAAQLGAKQI